MVLSFVISFFLFWGCSTETKPLDANYSKPTQSRSGKLIFETHCVKCHGNDGRKGISGAKDLSKSRLKDNEIVYVLRNGRKAMPPMIMMLKNPLEVDAVISHVKTLRK